MTRTLHRTVASFTEALQRRRRERIAFAERVWAHADDLVEQNLTVGGQYAPGTPVDTGEALFGWERRRQGLRTLFTNDVPHIVYLNRGWSAQAPEGITPLVVLHWPEIVRDATLLARKGVTPSQTPLALEAAARAFSAAPGTP
jgi:hypothetical protein